MQAAQASTLVIVGAGGHGRVVADAALAAGAWSRVVATDRDPARCGGELLSGVPILPFGQALALDGACFHVAIGSGQAREREAALLRGRLATVIHPRACVSRADVQPGCFVAAQAVVAPGARLGECAIVNHGAVVDHDAQVGAFTHVAPLASLSGQASVGRQVLVGTGARVLPAVQVCDGAVLGAGAVVPAAIDAPGVYVGAPARKVG